ncbi:MAG TPA: YihY/virulence factor BrkB family protein [Chthoniobacter sp.]|jgi:membrane protein
MGISLAHENVDQGGHAGGAIHRLMETLRGTGRLWSEHNILQLSAALSYYSIFSMAPLLVIAMALAGEFFGAEAVRGEVDRELRAGMGPAVAGMIQSMIQSAYQPGKGIWAGIVGVALLLVGAGGVFGQLKNALDLVWDTPRKKTSGIFAYVRTELVSFGMVLVIGFLMLTSLLLTTAIAAAWERVAIYLPFSGDLLAVVGVGISVGVIGTLFSFIFKWLPDLPIRWRDAWVGGLFTAALFEIGKFVLALYLGRESAASSYGAAGAVILILLWTYYSSAIVLTGACFTRAYAESFDKAKTPSQSNG